MGVNLIENYQMAGKFQHSLTVCSRLLCRNDILKCEIVGEVGGWNQQLPAMGSLVGDSLFTLRAEDVTPSPYNQSPYPPSGDTAGDACTVRGIQP